jgi:hypothetical protein
MAAALLCFWSSSGWMSSFAKPAKKPADETPGWTRENELLLSSVQSLYECRAEVIITHAPSTSDACDMHAQSVEKSIASLVLRLF